MINRKPIEQATDAVLRYSMAAIERAALRARDVARNSGTAIVVTRNGAIEYLWPDAEGQLQTNRNAAAEKLMRVDTKRGAASQDKLNAPPSDPQK
jgi:hypothetical protein